MYHVQRLQSFLMANDHVIFVPEGKCNIDIIMPITDPCKKAINVDTHKRNLLMAC